MENGTIISQITTSDALIPVENAYVWITQGNNLLNFQVTDKNGKTEPITLPAPDKSESLSPGNTSLAFGAYDIHVYHPMYQPFEIKNIQVFSGITTLQQLSLILQPEFAAAADNLTISDVTRQNL